MLLKYKFEQMGFITYLDNDVLPNSLLNDKCSILKPIIKNESKIFSRNVLVEVIDCNNKSLFITKLGSSRIKDFNKSYNIALRESLKSFGNYSLNYKASKENSSVVENNEILPKKELTISSSKDLLNGVKFSYNNTEYIIIKTGLSKYNIKKINEKDNIFGTIIPLNSKEQVYHINFDKKVGVFYFTDDGGVIVEFMTSLRNIETLIIKID
jgi:hypothetical protein